jgi:NAD(P)-dependent dehydrogenase (short-subunit alcohol dehydrogenase family)
MELAPRKITVNAICPGWVETDMARAGMEGIARRLGVSVEQFHSDAMTRVPLGRMLVAEEIAPLALYLLSDAAGMMTGQAINLCGGATTA